MKLIQSYWSLPNEQSIQGNYSRFNCGWPSEKHHAMSWAFSSLSIKKHNPKLTISLHTDLIGYHWLINEIGLKYDEVIVDLDELNCQSPHFWALGKIFTYSKQTEAFLHIDSDVYIWEPFSEDLLTKSLIAQNLEVNHSIYNELINEAISVNISLPKFNIDASSDAVNAGILGGNDLEFFRDFCKMVFKFISINKELILSMSSKGSYNMLFEQYFFLQLAKCKYGGLDDLATLIPDNKGFLHNLTRFGLVPQYSKYIHMIGQSKDSPELVAQLEQRLSYEFPKQYKYIDNYYKVKKTNYWKPNVEGLFNNVAICKKFINCNIYLKLLGYIAGTYQQKEIEDILELNFENRKYNKLWDIFQIESFNVNCSAQNILFKSSKLKFLYEYDAESFLGLKFSINEDVCGLYFLFQKWPLNINEKSLASIAMEIETLQLSNDNTLRPHIIYNSSEGLQIIEAKNWFIVYSFLYERSMTGIELLALLSQTNNNNVSVPKMELYEFLASQCFLYNRITFNE